MAYVFSLEGILLAMLVTLGIVAAWCFSLELRIERVVEMAIIDRDEVAILPRLRRAITRHDEKEEAEQNVIRVRASALAYATTAI